MIGPDTWIIIIAVLAALSCALLGPFLVLRKIAMLGDAISHSVLLGIVLAYLLTGTFSPIGMLIGAIVIGVVTTFITQLLQSKGSLQSDAAIGVTFTFLFALGLILIALFARKVHIEPECVLYGEITFSPWNTIVVGGIDLGPRAVWSLGFTTVINGLLVWIGFKPLKVTSFDPVLATSLGINVTLWHYILMTFVSITTVAAFEAVGVILVIAMFVIPASSAYLVAKSLGQMIGLSLWYAVLSSAGGYYLAFYFDGAIAAAMVMVSGAILIFHLLFIGKYSVLQRLIAKKR
ncbi:MAG: metal ABC transporter permease [Chlamydiota bacterium]